MVIGKLTLQEHGEWVVYLQCLGHLAIVCWSGSLLQTLRFRCPSILINFVFRPLKGGINTTLTPETSDAICALDHKWRQFTYLETYCQDQEIDGELDFLILASDGLWDVVPNEVSVPSTKFGTRLCFTFILWIVSPSCFLLKKKCIGNCICSTGPQMVMVKWHVL
jgi:hypothetical protein